MLILAHRGYSAKYPPNTLLSFKKAIEYGADGVELDVWRTKDGEIVISHDRNLLKATGVDLDVKNSTYNEISEKCRIEGEPVPLLREVYESLPNDAIVNVEIKDVDAVKGALDVVKEYDAMHRTLFSSFNIEALKDLKAMSKEAKIGILISDVNKIFTIPKWIYKLKAHSLNLPYQVANIAGERTTRTLIKFYRLFGARIFLWTVNEPDDLKPFHGLYEGVITDEVEKMVKFVRGGDEQA